MFMGNNTRVQVVSLGIVRLYLNTKKKLFIYFGFWYNEDGWRKK